MILSREHARQIAIIGASCSARERPAGALDAVERLGLLQLDPTAPVARTEQLVLWSRLGAGVRARRSWRGSRWEERALFEYRAFLYPAADFPLYRPLMEAWPPGEGRWQTRHRDWLEVNAPVPRRTCSAELEARGPLRSRDLEDRSVEPWKSTGWTNNRNVGQMLEFLWARGEAAVAGRDGSQRLWDLAERVLPVDAPRVEPAEAGRILADRRLRELGIVRAGVAVGRMIGSLGGSFDRGDGVRAEVEGVPGEWIVHPDLLDRPFAGPHGDPVPVRPARLRPRAAPRAVRLRVQARDLRPAGEAPLGLLRAPRAARRPARGAGRREGRPGCRRPAT